MNNLKENEKINEKVVNTLFEQIAEVILENKTKMTYQINNTLVETYFNIGKIIVENEQNGNIRAEYGKEVLKGLSKELTKLLGKGYSYTNLTYMRWFYNTYPDYSKINESLSWSHYIELITIKDDDKRNFYEKECINSNWSVRELQRHLIHHYLKDYYYQMVKQINKKF